MHLLLWGMKFAFQNGVQVYIGKAALVVDALAKGALVRHAGVAHHMAAGGVVALMLGLDAVEVEAGEAEFQHGDERLGHEAAVPVGAAEAVAHLGGAVFGLDPHKADGADHLARFAQGDDKRARRAAAVLTQKVADIGARLVDGAVRMGLINLEDMQFLT